MYINPSSKEVTMDGEAPVIILETDRLLLRRLLMSDLDDLYALYRDPEMRQYFPPEGVSPD